MIDISNRVLVLGYFAAITLITIFGNGAVAIFIGIILFGIMTMVLDT